MANALIDEATHLFSGEPNISLGERAASVVGGLGLMAIGAKPRPNKILSLVALLAGAALAMRGASGHCAYKALAHAGEPDRLTR